MSAYSGRPEYGDTPWSSTFRYGRAALKARKRAEAERRQEAYDALCATGRVDRAARVGRRLRLARGAAA